jgi:hypothetical protein
VKSGLSQDYGLGRFRNGSLITGTPTGRKVEMTGGSITANNIIAIAMLTVILLFFAYQSYIFMKDIRFYRRRNWDLSPDSGNRMLFLDSLRRSRKEPVGYLRLTIGLMQFGIGLLLLTMVLFYRALWFVRGSQSGESEVLALDKKTTTLIGVGFLLAFILFNWIGTLWLHKKVGADPSGPDIFDTYIGNRLSAKSRSILRYAVSTIVFLAYCLFLGYLVARQF